jgi:hypothetical protein
MRHDRHQQLHRLGARDQWTCFYCGVYLSCHRCEGRDNPTARTDATRDHVIPHARKSLPGYSKGGASNLVLACSLCNGLKGHGIVARGATVEEMIEAKKESIRQAIISQNLPAEKINAILRRRGLAPWQG